MAHGLHTRVEEHKRRMNAVTLAEITARGTRLDEEWTRELCGSMKVDGESRTLDWLYWEGGERIFVAMKKKSSDCDFVCGDVFFGTILNGFEMIPSVFEGFCLTRWLALDCF